MRKHFEVWLYIGVLLGLYGIMLSIAGVYKWVHPHPTVLDGKQATIWAGCILLVVGGACTIASWPAKSNKRSDAGNGE